MRLKFCVIGAALIIAGVGVLLLSPLRTTIGKSRQEKSSTNAVGLDTFRFPIEVVSNEVKNGTYLDIRSIFLQVDASGFSEQNLKDLFTTFAAEYQDPGFLHITAYSDREMLQRAINRSQDQGWCGVWPEDKLPAESGYFSAQYSRRDDAEYFNYTPDPEKPDTITVWFRMPSSRLDSTGKQY
jgi:hypothetical protein